MQEKLSQLAQRAEKFIEAVFSVPLYSPDYTQRVEAVNHVGATFLKNLHKNHQVFNLAHDEGVVHHVRRFLDELNSHQIRPKLAYLPVKQSKVLSFIFSDFLAFPVPPTEDELFEKMGTLKKIAYELMLSTDKILQQKIVLEQQLVEVSQNVEELELSVQLLSVIEELLNMRVHEAKMTGSDVNALNTIHENITFLSKQRQQDLLSNITISAQMQMMMVSSLENLDVLLKQLEITHMKLKLTIDIVEQAKQKIDVVTEDLENTITSHSIYAELWKLEDALEEYRNNETGTQK